MDVAKKIVDLLAGIAVIFTLVFIGLQWNEMRKGGEDTKALAGAAKAQAEAAQATAQAAKSQADNTSKLATAAVDQVAKLEAAVKETHALWWATKKSADAAKSTAENTARQLELSERPWIKIVDVKTQGDNQIIPALSFQKVGPYKDVGQQATFQLVLSLKNIGHSVADVAASYELFFPIWDGNGYWNVISSEQKRFCDSPAGKVPQFYPKFVVFPDELFDWHGAAAGLINPSVTNHLRDQGETGYILPVIIVCVNYRLRTLENSYQTRTIYEAFHVEDRTRFFRIGEGIPAKKILLIRNEMADDAY